MLNHGGRVLRVLRGERFGSRLSTISFHTQLETTMSRTFRRSAAALAALAIGLAWMTARPTGQNAGLPSTRKGDWTHYTADVRGTRYSPLDQINKDNFNKLEVAWRFKTDNLGTRPEYKLEGT